MRSRATLCSYMGLQVLEREKVVYYQQVEEFNKKLKEAQVDNNKVKLEALKVERSAIESSNPILQVKNTS